MRIALKQNKNNKILIAGDSHTRGIASIVKSLLDDKFEVCGIVKPGAQSSSLMRTANKDIAKVTKEDVLIIFIGTKDLQVNNSKIALKQTRSYAEKNNHTNMSLLNVPHCFDLTNSSHLINEIKIFNNNLLKYMKPQLHTKMLETDHDRSLFTKHGLHLNGSGKELLSRRIVSLIYSVLEEEKTDTPIILDWVNTQCIAINSIETEKSMNGSSLNIVSATQAL
jgi:hypothetical protein